LDPRALEERIAVQTNAVHAVQTNAVHVVAAAAAAAAALEFKKVHTIPSGTDEDSREPRGRRSEGEGSTC
jgi:hypothetical protein